MLVNKICKAVLITLLVPGLPPVFVFAAPAQDASPNFPLSRFEQHQGRYAVSFPIADGSRIHTVANEMTADADLGGAGFVVYCANMVPTSDVEKFFDEIEAEAMKANQAHIVRRLKIALGSVPGREVELENEKGWQRISRHYRRGNLYYQVLVQARGRQLNRAMAKAFFDSFTLLDGDPPPPTAMPSPAPVPAPSPALGMDTAPPFPTQAPDQGQAPLTVREEIVRMMHGTRYEDLAPAPPAPSAPLPQPTNQPAVDRRYANRAGRYMLDFPVTPSESERQLPSGAVLHQSLLELQGVTYLATYWDVPAPQLEQARTLPEGLAALYTAWKDAIISQTHATLQHEGSFPVAGREAYGAEFVLPDGTHVVGRMVIAGTRA
jgi:hypothetical protein